MSGRRKNQSTADFLKALIIRELINSVTKEFRQDIRNGVKYTRKKAGQKAKELARRYKKDGLWGVVRNKQQDNHESQRTRVNVETKNDSSYPTRFRDTEGGGDLDGDKNRGQEHGDNPNHKRNSRRKRKKQN